MNKNNILSFSVILVLALSGCYSPGITDTNNSATVINVNNNKGEQYVFLTDTTGTSRISLYTGEKNLVNINLVNGSIASPDSKYIYSDRVIYDKDGNTIYSFSGEDAVSATGWIDNKTLLVASPLSGTVTIKKKFNVETKKFEDLPVLADDYIYNGLTGNKYFLSPDGKKMVLSVSQFINGVSTGNNGIAILSITDNTVTIKKTIQSYDNLMWTKDNKIVNLLLNVANPEENKIQVSDETLAEFINHSISGLNLVKPWSASVTLIGARQNTDAIGIKSSEFVSIDTDGSVKSLTSAFAKGAGFNTLEILANNSKMVYLAGTEIYTANPDGTDAKLLINEISGTVKYFLL